MKRCMTKMSGGDDIWRDKRLPLLKNSYDKREDREEGKGKYRKKEE